VAFFGFGGGVGFGFGNVGWVPLAPYEVLNPWWGRGFYGGPGYINRSVNIVNVNITNVYRNARVTNGFMAVSGADFRSGRFNNFVRPSSGELSQASFARGPLPVTPNSTNFRFSDRQAAFVPRNTAPARVFSYRQPAPAQRMPLGDQRGFQPGTGSLPARPGDPPVAGRPSGWTRFGEPAGKSTLSPGSGPLVRNEGSVQRSGESRVAPAPSAEGPAQRGWSRFGEPSGPRQSYAPPTATASPRNSAPPANYQFTAGRGPEPLRVAPPVVRERQQGGSRFGTPGNGGFGGSRGGGGFSAPRGPSGGDRGSRSGGGGNRGGRNR